MDKLLNCEHAWALAYREWLATQGAVIIRSERKLIRNILDVAPGFDKFGFEDEAAAAVFILRWS